jgi:hypothetical protein
MSNKPKVFCIGFHKTGTTSMEKALKLLGYRVTGGNWVRDPDVAKVALKRALKLVPQYDAFQDNPWPMLYKEMDKTFPGSKFILTVRDPQKWVASVAKNFGTDITPMREWLYGEGRGFPKGNEAVYVERFERHNHEVLNYFSDREQDLLVMNVTEGDGWEKLCPFLGLVVPGVPFPRANVRAEKGWKGKLNKIKSLVTG